jgi:hypothetical protein
VNVYHQPSDTWYCSKHYVVLDADRRCGRCHGGSTWVKAHCVERWQERIEPGVSRSQAMAAVRKVVREGRRMSETKGRLPGTGCFTHHDWPDAVVVVELSKATATTVFLRGEGLVDQSLRVLSELLGAE